VQLQCEPLRVTVYDDPGFVPDTMCVSVSSRLVVLLMPDPMIRSRSMTRNGNCVWPVDMHRQSGPTQRGLGRTLPVYVLIAGLLTCLTWMVMSWPMAYVILPP
jgi:hypothetical protein